MSGETDLRHLLESMEPQLFDQPYSFRSVPHGEPLPSDAFAIVREEEGTTCVAPGEGWARISLNIHSSLQAVGLTAAFAAALTARNISANVIAGYYHDHIFVPWDHRHEALGALQTLSKGQGG